MPIYTYVCTQHGVFEVIQSMGENNALCPKCYRVGDKIMSHPAPPVIHARERLPLGTGSRGRYISHEETGGLDIFVPSWGAMEKEEVEYVTQGAIEKEKARVRKQRTERRAQKQIGELLSVAYGTEPGQRAKEVKRAIKEL